MEATKGIGQRSVKGYTKDFFLFDSWFSSKRSEEAAMSVGAEIICMVKTNQRDYVSIPLRILQSIGWEVVTSG